MIEISCDKFLTLLPGSEGSQDSEILRTVRPFYRGRDLKLAGLAEGLPVFGQGFQEQETADVCLANF